MANLNSVVLIGRLTRDPEAKTFATGGKNAKFGFVVNGRKKNVQTGEWVDEPMFIDVEVWNRGEFGKTADFVETYLKKGSSIAIQGQLKLDQWDDKATGQKRSKHKLVADSIQLLDKKADAPAGGGSNRAPAQAGAPPADENADEQSGDEIPF